ncbi:MAG: aminoglycoside 3'-phosphotransferase [Actinobacteria bacterium]|nr:aminoglycoside 3'-phosphotransferase [Actinomycetota bacterium]
MEIAKGAPLRCVWINGLGGLTFELTGADRFIKWAPPGVDLRLMEEAERLRWAAEYSSVPEVIDVGTADDGSTWLLTVALPGKTAVADEFKGTHLRTVRLLGEALRVLHDALPVETCPFTWSADERVGRARARASAGLADPRWWDGSHQHLSVDEALALVGVPPPIDELVVCHGDACSPNTLIDSEGRFAGHVDLGYLGTADRWADLAIATWSTTWNYGPGWEGELLAAYGIEADEERTKYYRLLWDLGD